MNLSIADQARLEEWWQHALANPQQLPPGLDLVHARLVRAVGRGELPDAGPVFVKLMWFPRAKDRLRYTFRALPGAHEAALFEHCRSRGVGVPTVLSVRARRQLGRPRLSMLVTASLPLLADPPSAQAIVEAVQQLIAVNLFHPDLHAGNFLPLRDGSVAVIDLQSARIRTAGLNDRDRRVMFAKLLDPAGGAGVERLGQVLVEKNLCSAAQVDRARADAGAVNRRELAVRIRRCLRESTEFSVRMGLFGTLYRRRAVETLGESVEGGAELVRYWIGDRVLEILESRPPICHALYRGRWPGRHRLFVPDGGANAVLAEADTLQQAHARYQDLR